jgi:UDP-N-acetylmuramate-alanine ligase
MEGLDRLAAELRPGDLFLTMGAGDNWRLGAALLERLGIGGAP